MKKKQVLYSSMMMGEKQVPGSLRKQALEKKQVRNRSLTEKAAANSKNTNQVVGVDGRDL